MTDLHGKNALVTGAARRLGKAIAVELARRGANLVVHYRDSEAQATETCREIESLGCRSVKVKADLSRLEEVRSLAAQATERLGPIEILINSASLFFRTPFGQVTGEQWDQLFHINLQAPFFLAQSLASGMKSRGWGRIINIGDAGTHYSSGDFLPYSMTKAALELMTKALARALAPEVQVCAVLPGPILPAESGDDEQWQAAIRQTLLKKHGTPQDIALAVAFLLEQGDFLTGVLLPVDGGRRIGR